MLEEDIGRPIGENGCRLDELSRWNPRLGLPNNLLRRLDIPGPSKVRPAAHETAQDDETVPEEDATFNEMRQSTEDPMGFLFR